MSAAGKLKKLYTLMDRSLGPQNWWPGDTPFEIAVGAVLTQNTNWGNVERAIANLKHARALSARAIHSMPEGELASLIRPAGYFNVKARRLKNFVGFLAGNHGGSLKRLARGDTALVRELLLEVNGIGPETADSIILYALEKPVFVIDAYTRRVLSRHHIMEAERGYEEFRALFERAIEPDVGVYNQYHALLVNVGKHFCRPREPRCGRCPLEGV